MASDEIRNECAPTDRGAFDQLTFQRCGLGYTLSATTDYNRRTTTFAFRNIEDVAAWLLQQYGLPPLPCSAPKAARKKSTTRSRSRR